VASAEAIAEAVKGGRGAPQRGAIPKPRVSAAPPWVREHRMKNNPERVA